MYWSTDYDSLAVVEEDAGMNYGSLAGGRRLVRFVVIRFAARL